MQGLGAYTTRNAPAPENGDEIVAGPIDAAHYFAQYFAQYCKLTRAARARFQYFKYMISVIK
jgi:hypothetical protein